ncbi:hypothetical protein [Rhizobium sp. CSW-27]|uniref:hypothetical protein n=1 Tax=Rhizobium sp. CSW-27 TaxID=2839985 RepID=UPI001C0132C3|nr:hypothetical protein [Rhizobium sp. CSW-27]MBT9368657.1 hypothetical protein [Rhizobium sp. CSW-27]
MQIQSGLSGYGYSGRSYSIERRTEAATEQRQTDQPQRSASALTGSSTLLSSSLANALWAVENARSDAGQAGHETAPLLQTPAGSIEKVEDVYSEF